jgi:trimeric autotransporter adhesin
MQFKRTGSSSLRRALLLSLLPLMCVAPLRIVQAVNPPPDGGYPGGNTAEGTDALLKLTNGDDNTAVGLRALYENLAGNRNSAVGALALKNNSRVDSNTATGFQALYTKTGGSRNTANGYKALTALAGGRAFNTAIGSSALDKLSGGDSNIAVGSRAGTNLTNSSGNVYIGNNGVAGDSGTIRIGGPQHARTFISGIRGVAVSGNPVVVDAGGQLGVPASSARLNHEIEPMDKASEAILALEPITFRYKKQVDPENTPQFGLLAEDVEKINPDLVLRDKEGKPYSVRYDQVNAMLLNEFLKAHREMEEQEAIIGRQEKQIEALAADLQKVSDQLELRKPAPQTVLNNQ